MQVYIGIDWSEDKQDVVFMNQAGVDVTCLTIPHSLDGFVQLDAARRKLGLAPGDCTVGLETAHNLIIEYLWSQAYQQVYVIPPSVVKCNRSRFRQSEARDDQSDGYLLADILRTDRDRSVPAERSHFLIAYPSLHLLLGAIRVGGRSPVGCSR